MKKIIFRLTAALVGVYLLLSFLDRKGEYDAERSLWRINRQLDVIAREPEVIPDITFHQLIERYRNFIENYPQSRLVPQAYMLIAKVDLLKKDYDAARREYARIPAAFPHDPQHIAESMAAIGKTYEMQGDWPKAQQQYDNTIRLYPVTLIGLQLPLYIANHLAGNNPSGQANDLYSHALAQYKYVLAHYHDKETDIEALKLLSALYLARQDWPQSVECAREILLMNPDEQSLREAMSVINIAAIIRMKNYDLPIAIYKEFINKHPHDPMLRVFKGMVASITDLKKSHVTLTVQQPNQRAQR